MSFRNLILNAALGVALGACLLTAAGVARAGGLAAADVAAPAQSSSALDRYARNIQELSMHALSYIGINYRHGGESPETGFDCSGLVRYVFRESIGLSLPRTARDMSRVGESVRSGELQPGDLVFFNTLRRGFSHVGIYLGEHRFVHAPSTGGQVRIEDMRGRYWVKRFSGARRMPANTQIALN